MQYQNVYKNILHNIIGKIPIQPSLITYSLTAVPKNKFCHAYQSNPIQDLEIDIFESQHDLSDSSGYINTNQYINLESLLNNYQNELNLQSPPTLIVHLADLNSLLTKQEVEQCNQLVSLKGYPLLINTISKNIPTLHPKEIETVFHWIFLTRKYNIQNKVSSNTISSLVERIFLFSKHPKIRFKNICTYLYTINALAPNRFNEILAIFLQKIHQNPELTYTFPINWVSFHLRFLSQKSSLSLQESIFATLLLQRISNSLPQLPVSKLCTLFRDISKLQMHVKPPKFQIPTALENIQAKIQGQMAKLDLKDTIYLIEAYSYLPLSLQRDISYKLNKIILKNINKIDSKVNSETILELLIKLMTVENILPLTHHNLEKIYNVIIEKIEESDEILATLPNFETIVKFYFKKGYEYPKLLSSLHQAINSTDYTTAKTLPINTLSQLISYNYDVTPFLEQYIQNNQDKLQSKDQIGLYMLFKGLGNHDLAEKYLNELKLDSLYIIESTLKAISKQSKLLQPFSDDIQQNCCEKLVSMFEKSPPEQWIRALVFSIQSRKIRIFWADKIFIEQSIILSDKHVNYLLDFVSELGNEQIHISFSLFLVKVLKTTQAESINISKLILMLREKGTIVEQLFSKESIFVSLLERVIEVIKAQNNEINPGLLFGFIQKLEWQQINPPILVELAKIAWAQAIKTQASTDIKTSIGLYLEKKGALSADEALQCYQETKARKKYDLISNSAFLSYAIISDLSKIPQIGKLAIKNQMLDLTNQLFSSDSINTKMRSVIEILQFPEQYWSSHITHIHTFLSNHLEEIPHHLFVHFISSIPVQAFNTEDKAMLDLLKAIRDHIKNSDRIKEISNYDLVQIIINFSQIDPLPARNPSYETLIRKLYLNSNKIYHIQIQEVLKSVKSYNITFRKFVNSVFDRILKNLAFYHDTIPILITNMASNCFDITNRQDFLKQIFEEFLPKNPKVALPLLYLITVQPNSFHKASYLQELVKYVENFDTTLLTPRASWLLYHYYSSVNKDFISIKGGLKQSIALNPNLVQKNRDIQLPKYKKHLMEYCEQVSGAVCQGGFVMSDQFIKKYNLLFSAADIRSLKYNIEILPYVLIDLFIEKENLVVIITDPDQFHKEQEKFYIAENILNDAILRQLTQFRVAEIDIKSFEDLQSVGERFEYLKQKNAYIQSNDNTRFILEKYERSLISQNMIPHDAVKIRTMLLSQPQQNKQQKQQSSQQQNKKFKWDHDEEDDEDEW